MTDRTTSRFSLVHDRMGGATLTRLADGASVYFQPGDDAADARYALGFDDLASGTDHVAAAIFDAAAAEYIDEAEAEAQATDHAIIDPRDGSEIDRRATRQGALDEVEFLESSAAHPYKAAGVRLTIKAVAS